MSDVLLPRSSPPLLSSSSRLVPASTAICLFHYVSASILHTTSFLIGGATPARPTPNGL